MIKLKEIERIITISLSYVDLKEYIDILNYFLSTPLVNEKNKKYFNGLNQFESELKAIYKQIRDY